MPTHTSPNLYDSRGYPQVLRDTDSTIRNNGILPKTCAIALDRACVLYTIYSIVKDDVPKRSTVVFLRTSKYIKLCSPPRSPQSTSITPSPIFWPGSLSGTLSGDEDSARFVPLLALYSSGLFGGSGWGGEGVRQGCCDSKNNNRIVRQKKPHQTESTIS